MTTWDRAVYTERLLPPRQQHQLESLISEATGKPVRRTSAADQAGYGLGVQQLFNSKTGTFWAYEGQTFGARVVHYYFPRTGLVIAVAANSSTTNDDLNNLAGAVYQTLDKTGALHTR